MTELLTAQSTRFDFHSCHAEWSDGVLSIGNGLIERKWRMTESGPAAVSIRDLVHGAEWLAGPSAHAAPCPAGNTAGSARPAVSIESWRGGASPVEEPSLRVELSAAWPEWSARYRFQVFPSSAAIRAQLIAAGPAANGPSDAGSGRGEATGVEKNAKPLEAVAVRDCMENFVLGPRHFRLIAVELRDQTDMRDELVFEREWLPQYSEWDIVLKGNLFIVEESFSGNGLIFLKQAPLPHARPAPDEVDFSYSGRSRQLTLRGHGIAEAEGYPWAVLAYGGGRLGRIEALQSYQRQLRAFVPGRDGLFLSNTWGDRSRDARINEAFMRLEVEAGARLGVEVIQIDDGWQRGVTANSALAATGGGVWDGFWKANPDFWEAHLTRFPNGLEGIIALAKGRGMQFGLWFAPDSSNDFSNWRRDAERVVELHRRLGVSYFKFDGVKVHTRAGEQNLGRLFESILAASGGRIVIDLDVTAESRPGYFGLVNGGPLFIENRYTDWHNYWPHQTLRNLWRLSHYVDPARLRFEFLNVSRNGAVYGEDPLAPGRYRPDYLFATVMFSNPLGWFETSNLPDAYFEQLQPLVKKWKEHRDAIFGGRIYPIGETPDGTGWTGFVSAGGGEGRILVFRELNGRGSYEIALPMLPPDGLDIEVLGGEGGAEFSDGKLMVHIPNPQRFLFAHLKARSR